MLRRSAIALLAAAVCAFALLGGASSGATSAVTRTAQPAGPRLAVVVKHDSGRSTTAELVTIGPLGETPQVVAHETGRFLDGTIGDDEHPNWSPDGSELAYYGSGDETPAVYLQGTDGSPARVLASSEHPGGPDDAILPEPLFDPKTGDLIVAVVHTPNGEGLFGDARPAGKPAAIRTEYWALSVDGRKARRLSSRTLSRRRPLIPFPSSVSARGKVAASAVTRRGFAVVTADPRTGATRTVVPTTTQAEGGVEPAISPDGKEIIYKVDKGQGADGEEGLISTDLMIVPTTGGKPTLLARVKGGIRWPSWDPSGSRIVFTALNAAGEIDYPGPQDGSSLMEINPDGTCLTQAFTVAGGAVYGAAWQPGADRGVGPLSC
jgi:Tol biopolymer transport system component